MNTTITKRDLVERGVEALLEKAPPSPGVTVAHHAAGGVSQVNLPQVVEIAKFMAGCQEGVPPHCRGNVGICLRVTFQAVEWQMSPFSVADMSYVVGGKLAYMSQLLHAVVEGRAPLMHRLECEYLGEGPDRQCIVRGQFITGDLREYVTPKLKDIKVKNSPLWTSDVDQQLFYFASRSWARKWAPDILLGCYTKEEIQRFPELEDRAPGLHARLSGAAKSEEGHQAGHAVETLKAVVEHASDEATEPQDSVARPVRGKRPGKKEKRASGAAKAENVSHETNVRGAVATKVAYPSSIPEYLAYARGWLKAETDKVEIGQRWNAERKLRNSLGVTADDRAPLEELMKKRLEQ